MIIEIKLNKLPWLKFDHFIWLDQYIILIVSYLLISWREIIFRVISPSNVYIWLFHDFGKFKTMKIYSSSQLDFCLRKFVQKNYVPQKLCPTNLFKICSLTAETLLICKYVARTYFAWTNVIVSSTRKLHVKFAQSWISNSWNLDKCHQDKCWLDKCHCDSWNLF